MRDLDKGDTGLFDGIFKFCLVGVGPIEDVDENCFCAFVISDTDVVEGEHGGLGGGSDEGSPTVPCGVAIGFERQCARDWDGVCIA